MNSKLVEAGGRRQISKPGFITASSGSGETGITGVDFLPDNKRIQDIKEKRYIKTASTGLFTTYNIKNK